MARLQEENEGEEITLRRKITSGDQMEEREQTRPLIIDLGTYTTKVGFSPSDLSSASDCFPSLMVPTLVGLTNLLPGRLSDTSL